MNRFNRAAWILATALAFLPPSGFAQDLLGAAKKALGEATKSSSGTKSDKSGLDIAGGLKEALKIGTDRTVSRLGQNGGYLKDQNVKIPLPGSIEKVRTVLSLAGAGPLVDDLETKMNRAAEKAAPQARDIFVDAISGMTIKDAQSILNGPQDAATQFFKRETTSPLKSAMRPIIEDSLQDVGAVKAMGDLGKSAKGVGSALGFDLTDYVMGKALDGLFLYIGKEEAAIRQDPAKRSTDLLRQVFAK